MSSIKKYKSGQFLDDFGLESKRKIEQNIRLYPTFYSKVLRFKDEGDKHYKIKLELFDFLRLYFKNDKKFFICNELQQKKNPFYRAYYDRTDCLYRLDICIVYWKTYLNPLIINIEIDGNTHYTGKGMMKDRIRDELLEDRYGIEIFRVDVNDHSFGDVLRFIYSKIGSESQGC
jgi:hypothetical protein